MSLIFIEGHFSLSSIEDSNEGMMELDCYTPHWNDSIARYHYFTFCKEDPWWAEVDAESSCTSVVVYRMLGSGQPPAIAT